MYVKKSSIAFFCLPYGNILAKITKKTENAIQMFEKDKIECENAEKTAAAVAWCYKQLKKVLFGSEIKPLRGMVVKTSDFLTKNLS